VFTLQSKRGLKTFAGDASTGLVAAGKVLSSDLGYWAPNLRLAEREFQLSSGQAQSQGRIRPGSVVYWMRVGLALVAGFSVHLLRINYANWGELAFYIGIGVGIAFYLLSILMVRDVLRYGEVELKGKNRYITLGGGTFIVLWIMISVLLNTLGI
jgi:hypothetical protein